MHPYDCDSGFCDSTPIKPTDCAECDESPANDDERHASERGQEWVCASCRLCSDCRKVERMEDSAMCEDCTVSHEAWKESERRREAYIAHCDDKRKEQREERGFRR
jgi:hypothetical protein